MQKEYYDLSREAASLTIIDASFSALYSIGIELKADSISSSFSGWAKASRTISVASSGLSDVSKVTFSQSPIFEQSPQPSKQEEKEETTESSVSLSDPVEDSPEEQEKESISSEEVALPSEENKEESISTEEKNVETPSENVSFPPKEETVESTLDSSHDAPVSTKPRLRRFERVHKGVVKAILVNKTQYQKLCASLPTQEKILEQKEVLLPLPTEDALSSSSEDREVQMEKMMEQAKELYKQGKAEEAQSLLTEISAMNSKK